MWKKPPCCERDGLAGCDEDRFDEPSSLEAVDPKTVDMAELAVVPRDRVSRSEEMSVEPRVDSEAIESSSSAMRAL